jgi:hypothetical protein
MPITGLALNVIDMETMRTWVIISVLEVRMDKGDRYDHERQTSVQRNTCGRTFNTKMPYRKETKQRWKQKMTAKQTEYEYGNDDEQQEEEVSEGEMEEAVHVVKTSSSYSTDE